MPSAWSKASGRSELIRGRRRSLQAGWRRRSSSNKSSQGKWLFPFFAEVSVCMVKGRLEEAAASLCSGLNSQQAFLPKAEGGVLTVS